MAKDEGLIGKETVIAVNPKAKPAPLSISFYVILGMALFAFIRTFSLLSPILLSLLMVLLISLAVNPVIFRMWALTGGVESYRQAWFWQDWQNGAKIPSVQCPHC